MSRDEFTGRIKAEFQFFFFKRYPMMSHGILATEESILISQKSLKIYILKPRQRVTMLKRLIENVMKMLLY